MSNENPDQAAISEAAAKDLAIKHELNNKEAESTTIKFDGKIDVYSVFKELDKMRQEGVSEEVLVEALDQFMKDRKDKYRKTQMRIVKSKGMVAMPTQDEMNKFYEDRIVKGQITISHEGPKVSFEALVEALALAKARRIEKLKPTLKMYWYRFLHTILGGIVSTLVWIFGKLGVK